MSGREKSDFTVFARKPENNAVKSAAGWWSDGREPRGPGWLIFCVRCGRGTRVALGHESDNQGINPEMGGLVWGNVREPSGSVRAAISLCRPSDTALAVPQYHHPRFFSRR